MHIVIEGILFEKIFEADPEIKFTYAWSKRNVYKQKVYGLTTARGKIYMVAHTYIFVSSTIYIEYDRLFIRRYSVLVIYQEISPLSGDIRRYILYQAISGDNVKAGFK